MNDKQKTPAQLRAERLAAQLRTNLQRRKLQSRARRAGEADQTRGLPVTSKAEERERD